MTKVFSTKLAKDSCNYAINSGSKSNETNIKITKDIAGLFIDNLEDFENRYVNVKFLIYKEDFVKSLCQIIAHMPVSLTKTGAVLNFSIEYFNKRLKSINDFFGNEKVKEKSAILTRPKGHSFCLNFGKNDPLPIREFCLEKKTVLYFAKSNSTITLRIRIESDSDESYAEPSESKIERQIIYYGAPGTGKSYAVKAITGELDNKKHENVFRTTFHPDTDYSSFVGCYKPVPKGASLPIKTLKELKYDYNIIKDTEDDDYASKFGALYWNSLSLIKKDDIMTLLNSEDEYSKIEEGYKVGEFLSKNKKDIISYDFIPQIFTNAYVYAYKNPNINTYLVIEEINRGNCAQIFGDLFQLLDRKPEGSSDYPIKVDADLQRYLEKELGKNNGIIDGKISLPSNLIILATMNTSDQSLFPIDSAFKRRWDWRYVPIEQPGLGLIGNPRVWKISANGHWCYWWEFLIAINEIIEETKHSEDKQLGYYFIKPDDGEYISAESFVSKVIFYLWNDVFKDEDNIIFRYKELEGDWHVEDLKVKRSELFFRNFIISTDEVDEKLVQWFINNILVDRKVPMLDDNYQEPISSNTIARMRSIGLPELVQDASSIDDSTDESIENPDLENDSLDEYQDNPDI